MKKILFPIVVLVIIIVAGIAIYSSTKGEEKNSSQEGTTESEQVENNQANNSDTEEPTEESTKTDGPVAILFYSYTCGYCKDVNDWLEKNDVKNKIKFDHLEISSNKDNNVLLTDKAKSCGLDENQIGVPFLYDIENNKCMSGSDKVIDFFENKI
ncbi:MAG: hypothetical protein PHH45_00595 [Patescibacteria group bacterium]|jgi:glutaredoxin-related protein|nr:hypothetical protein [Patescibacteria group bacterium]